MQHSNCYWNVKNIDHSITSLNRGLFNGKIGYRLHIALFFLFYWNFQPPPSTYVDPLPPTYLILPNVPTPCLIGPLVYSGPKSKQIRKSTGIVPKILRPKVLLIVTAVAWKTSHLWGLEQVSVDSKISCINHYSTKHIFLVRKELLINVLFCEGAIEKRFMKVLLKRFWSCWRKVCLSLSACNFLWKHQCVPSFTDSQTNIILQR